MALIAENVRMKRVYDEPSPDDGLRILITRYWPRGVPKSAIDEYATALAPSRELVRAFKHEGMTWHEYEARFLDEMRSETARSAISRLADLAGRETITLMCICPDDQHCHRRLVKDLVLAQTP